MGRRSARPRLPPAAFGSSRVAPPPTVVAPGRLGEPGSINLSENIGNELTRGSAFVDARVFGLFRSRFVRIKQRRAVEMVLPYKDIYLHT